MLNLGPRITQFRIQRGLTQAVLASKCAIPQPNLSNIEKGKQDLTVSTLVRLAAALEIKPAAFFEEIPHEGMELNRETIEAVALAVVNPQKRFPAEIKQTAALFREIIPETNPRGSARKINAAWNRLKERFSTQEIQGVCQRVQDALQRRP